MRGFGIFNSENIPSVSTSDTRVTEFPSQTHHEYSPLLRGEASQINFNTPGLHNSKSMRATIPIPDPRLRQTHTDALTAKLRKASVDFHMEWVEKLIKKVHEDLCQDSFRQALYFIKSLHGEVGNQEVLNRLGLAKVGVLELRTDFNADHRSQFLELFKNRLETELDFVCIELTSLDMPEDAMGMMARKQRLLDKVIEEIIMKCTYRLTYVLDRPFHKSSSEARKHQASHKKGKKKRHTQEDDIYTELGLESVHPSSMLSKPSRTSMTKRGAPGSRSNPIHPSLDHFFMKFERNGLPKRIALLIRNADSALPALLQEMLHTLQLYTEHCGLQLVVLLPRASVSSLPVLSVNEEFVILKEVALPTCAKLGMQILYAIQSSPAKEAPLLLCDKAFSQLASFFTHYYGSLRGFRTQLRAFLSEAIQHNPLYYLHTLHALGVPEYIMLSEFKTLPKLMTMDLSHLISARTHSRQSMKLPPEMGESRFNMSALERAFEGAARKKDEWVKVLKWIEKKMMSKFDPIFTSDKEALDKKILSIYKEVSVPQVAGVTDYAPSKDQKELLKFYANQRKLRLQSITKDRTLECFSKVMDKPSETLYALLSEHSDKQLQEEVRRLVVELRDELNMPDQAVKLEDMMEKRLKHAHERKSTTGKPRTQLILDQAESKRKKKDERDVVEMLGVQELKKVLRNWCDSFMKTQFAWWEWRPHPSPDHPFHSFLCVGTDSYLANEANTDLAERYIQYCESVENNSNKVIDVMRLIIHQFSNSDGTQLDLIETLQNIHHGKDRLHMQKNELRAYFMKAIFLLKQSGFLRSDGKIPSVARMMLYKQKHVTNDSLFSGN